MLVSNVDQHDGSLFCVGVLCDMCQWRCCRLHCKMRRLRPCLIPNERERERMVIKSMTHTTSIHAYACGWWFGGPRPETLIGF